MSDQPSRPAKSGAAKSGAAKAAAADAPDPDGPEGSVIDAPDQRRPGLFRRPSAVRAIGRDEEPNTFVDLRDDGLHAHRAGDFVAAEDYLSRALSLKPDAQYVQHIYAECLLKLGRETEAFDITTKWLREREHARLRKTRTYAARAILRQALRASDPTRFFDVLRASREDLAEGVHGAEYLMITGALAGDRADVQSGHAQLVARARFEDRRATEAAARRAARSAEQRPAQDVGGEASTGAASATGDTPSAEPPDAVAPTLRDRLNQVYARIAEDARLLFEIDDTAAAFILDVVISAAPDEPLLRAERLWMGLQQGEIDNPNVFLDYALDRRAYGGRIEDLMRVYRFTRELRSPAAATRALRALRLLQIDVLNDSNAPLSDLEAAGHAALDFGDFATARDVRNRLEFRAGRDLERRNLDAALAAASPPSASDGQSDGEPSDENAASASQEDVAPASAQDALRRFSLAFADATRASGDLAPDFAAAAQNFWRDILDASDPVATFFDDLPEDWIAVTAPPGLLTAEPEERDLRAMRQTVFAALRVFTRFGLEHELKLFPWSSRELERIPRGKAVFCHGRRRGPRANRFLCHGATSIPQFAYVDRFGCDGWSEVAQTLPFVEARSSEIAAFFEAVRAAVLGPTPRASDAPPPATVAILLQSPTDPLLELARISLRDLVQETIAWAERRERPVLIWRPRSCRHRGVTELLEQVANIDRVRIERAPEGPGALGRAMRDVAGLATVNAPEAVEAILALKTVILGGGSDLHHATRSLETPEQLPGLLDVIDARPDPAAIARFFYDYLTGRMINLLSPADLEAKLAERLVEAGWVRR